MYAYIRFFFFLARKHALIALRNCYCLIHSFLFHTLKHCGKKKRK